MKKQYWIFVCITCVFLCLLTGIFIGRNLTDSYFPIDNILESQYSDPTGAEQDRDGRLNINTATLQQLQLLPGIGESTAKKIIVYREENGDFKAIEDLMNVSGIGSSKFEKIKSYIKTEN